MTDHNTPERACLQCGGSMEGKRVDAEFCSALCRDRARRQRDREAGKPTTSAAYVRKGRSNPRPTRQKYSRGWVSPSGALTLVTRNGKRAVFKCECGNLRELDINNVRKGVTKNCADRASHPDPRVKTEDVAYSTAHHKVAEAKGPASDHSCFRCGEQAEQWAFLHGTHDVKADETGREAGSPFSVDPKQYAPMCRLCHVRWDKAKQRVAGNAVSLVHIGLWAVLFEGDVEAA